MKLLKNGTLNALFFLLAVLIAFPVFLMVMQSLMPSWTMTTAYVNGQTAKLEIVPMPITFVQYKGALLLNQKFLSRFWHSFLWCLLTTVVQVVLSFAAGYVLAKVRFYGRNLVLGLFILAMLMPLQVTLVPQYIIASQLGILNTNWALYLPLAFAPFGAFLMRQTIAPIPEEMIEYARLEGAGTFRLLYHVVGPYATPGLLILFLFSFAEAWNIIEQPMVLMTDPSMYPVSLLIHTQGELSPQFVFVAAVVFMIPILSFLLYFRDVDLEGMVS